MTQWRVIGISGVTCGGKTTLSQSLCTTLTSNKTLGIKSCQIMNQDDYFHDANDKRHTFIPELNHINWEIITALDMNKMYNDVKTIIKTNQYEERKVNIKSSANNIISNKCNLDSRGDEDVDDTSINVLIVEGFLILNYPLLRDLCDIKFHIDLTKEQCWARRCVRVYDPPDVEGYFESYVWPEYLQHKKQIVASNVDVHMLDGTKSNLCDTVTQVITQFISGID